MIESNYCGARPPKSAKQPTGACCILHVRPDSTGHTHRSGAGFRWDDEPETEDSGNEDSRG